VSTAERFQIGTKLSSLKIVLFGRLRVARLPLFGNFSYSAIFLRLID
jgi:hypothetical protein